jgi:hypothetical protein
MSGLLLTLLLLASDAGIEPPQSVQVHATPDKVRLGDPFTVEVVITHPKNERIDLRAPGDTGDFDLEEAQRSRIEGPTRSTTTFKLPMSAFALGQKTTPDLTFDVVQGEATGSFTTPGTPVEVVSSLPADAADKGAGLFDVRPPEAVPIRTWRLLYALAALVGAGLLIWALRRWLKRPRAKPLEAPKPRLPLPQRTLAALDALAQEELPAKGRAQEFYFRLSEIVRSYLGERYGFEALESTSTELLDAVRRMHTPGLAVKELSEFALMSDMAKFAKVLPNADECKSSLEFGYRLVHTTTEALPPPAAVPTSNADRPRAP